MLSLCKLRVFISLVFDLAIFLRPDCLLALFLVFLESSRTSCICELCLCVPWKSTWAGVPYTELILPMCHLLACPKNWCSTGRQYSQVHNQHTYSWNPFHPGLVRHEGTPLVHLPAPRPLSNVAVTSETKNIERAY
jgi:hypothetical protein